MARGLLTRPAMTPSLANSFPVRKLRRAGPYDWWQAVAFGEDHREVNCEELRLSSVQLEAALEARQLRASDLVFVNGCWTPIASAYQFEETAAPHLRRERLGHAVARSLVLLGGLGAFLAVNAVAALWLEVLVY